MWEKIKRFIFVCPCECHTYGYHGCSDCRNTEEDTGAMNVFAILCGIAFMAFLAYGAYCTLYIASCFYFVNCLV